MPARNGRNWNGRDRPSKTLAANSRLDEAKAACKAKQLRDCSDVCNFSFHSLHWTQTQRTKRILLQDSTVWRSDCQNSRPSILRALPMHYSGIHRAVQVDSLNSEVPWKKVCDLEAMPNLFNTYKQWTEWSPTIDVTKRPRTPGPVSACCHAPVGRKARAKPGLRAASLPKLVTTLRDAEEEHQKRTVRC